MKKLMVFLLIISFVITGIFAAGAKEDTVTLTYFQYKTEIVEELEQLFALFQQENPTVRIELETPSNFATVLKSRINAKNIPDIY